LGAGDIQNIGQATRLFRSTRFFSLHSNFFFLLLSTTAQRLDCDGDGVGGYRFVPVFVGFNVIDCAQGAKRAKNVFQSF
jgi:hypothetical protein